MSTPGRPDAGTLSVVFVCMANICRSPFMELLAADLAGDALDVSSAGTRGTAGHPMSEEMAVLLRERGVTEDGFRSRPLTGEVVEAADLVLTAEAAHRDLAVALRPDAAGRVFTLGQFAAAVDDDDSGLTGRALVAHLGEHHTAADPALDVADPYRRGPQVSSACATQIEGLLRVVVPALTGTRKIAP